MSTPDDLDAILAADPSINVTSLVVEIRRLREKVLMEPWDLLEGVKKDRQNAINQIKRLRETNAALVSALEEMVRAFTGVPDLDHEEYQALDLARDTLAAAKE